MNFGELQLNHSPERRRILDHLLTYGNVGPDRSYDSSERSQESLRIESVGAHITDDIRSRALDKSNDTYLKIKQSVTNSLSHVTDLDKWMILHAVADVLEQKRINMLANVVNHSSTVSYDHLYFASRPTVFVSRLWPEEDPPWIYPMPAVMWDTRIPLSQLYTHLARAKGDAAQRRIRSLTIPLGGAAEEASEAVEYVQREADPIAYDQFVRGMMLDRKRLTDSANALEALSQSCRNVIDMREMEIKKGKKQGRSRVRSSDDVHHFSEVYHALIDQQLDQSVPVALRTTQMLMSNGEYRGAVSSAHTVLHGVLKNTLKKLELEKYIRKKQNPKDIFGIIRKHKPDFFDSNSFTAEIAEMHGSMNRILEALREVRSNGTTPHPNDIISQQQAVLCLYMISALIMYLRTCDEEYHARGTDTY